MIDLYTWTTPNGHKIHIMLEETGLPYRVHRVNLSNKEQFDPDYVKINPNSKIPAIIDQEGPKGRPITIFESGAILTYLAEKSGKFLPKDPKARSVAMQWLNFQVGNIGPMFGQLYHFRSSAPERIAYAVNRYSNEVRRLYGVLDRRLAQSEFFAGEYSIADIAIFPWVKNPASYDQDPDEVPNVMRWVAAVKSRPAVKRGFKVLETR